MKRLLMLLLLASPAFAQTHTFPALDTNNAFSGNNTFLNLNDILWVGPGAGSYNTIAAAVAAAGSVNRTIIAIRSTYAGGECGAYQTNLVYWDFRGGTLICNNDNTITYNSVDASGVNALARLIHNITAATLPAGGSPVAWYQETYLTNINFNGSQADGSSADLNFFGTNSGTMPLASGHELAVAVFGTASGNASTGGTIQTAMGAHGYVSTLAGSTTVINNAFGFNGIGCNAIDLASASRPQGCGGLIGRRQLGKGSSWNYAVVNEGVSVFRYDSNISKGGFDCEDNGAVAASLLMPNARPCFFVDATNQSGTTQHGILTLQAVSPDGLSLASSDGASRFSVTSSLLLSKIVHRFAADVTPNAAAGSFLGSSSLPWAGFSIGTAATNNFTFTPSATAAQRTITMPDPLGNVNLPFVIASGTSTLTVNAALAAVTSQAAITTAATGALTTDAIEWSYASAPGAGDSLCHISPYVTAGNVNFVRTNPTAGAQSVSAIVINWRVIR